MKSKRVKLYELLKDSKIYLINLILIAYKNSEKIIKPIKNNSFKRTNQIEKNINNENINNRNQK